MRLADEIIETLGREHSSLTDALLKTKILLHKIGHKELVEWVDHELNGYPNEQAVPAYRVLSAQVRANLVSPGWQYTGHPIPTGHLKAEERERLENAKMDQPLAVLERMCGEKTRRLQAAIPVESNHRLQEGLSGARILSAWCEITPAQVAGIFVQVRSRLLDFLLALNEEFPPDLGDDELKRRGSTIDAAEMFNNTVYANRTSAPTTVNIDTFIGSMQQSQIQRDVQSSTQALTVNELDLDAVRRFVSDLDAALGRNDVQSDRLEELKADLASIKAQLGSPTPKQSIIRECLVSARHVMEHAGGKIVGSGLLEAFRTLVP